MTSERRADVIVIGGGVAGLSTALQIAARGRSVRLFDRGALGSGATGQASGLLGQLRSNAESVRMLMESVEILKNLERQAGETVFTASGSLRVAQTPARAREIEEAVKVGLAAGLEVREVDPTECARMVPYMRTDDILSACYVPSDGYLHPPELAQLYVKVAASRGVDLRPNTPVEQILIADGRVTGIRAGGVVHETPVVVNVAGPWSHLIADLAEQRLPTAGVAHCYFVVAPDPSHPVDPLSPSIRDRENRLYARPTRTGGMHIGIYEARPVSYEMDRLPTDFRMADMRVEPDRPVVHELLEAARQRFPWIGERTAKAVKTGIMSWTPDGQALCGEMPAVEGLYHCAGFCGHGVMQSAVIGKIMAEMIVDGACRYDLAEIAADRFYDLPELADRAVVTAKAVEAYATCYGHSTNS